MSVWDYFDCGAFVVNLDRRPDRWDAARAELARCGIERFERFAAVDNPENGAAGCCLSHRAIWRRLAAGDLGERALILEDDFCAIDRETLLRLGYKEGSNPVGIYDSCLGTTVAGRFAAMLPEVPARWDLLYLAGSYECAPRARVSPHVVRNNGMHGTLAYAISRALARRLTEKLDASHPPPAHVGGPDSVLADVAKEPDVAAYTFSPRLMAQRLGFSDVQRREAGPEWALFDTTHEMSV